MKSIKRIYELVRPYYGLIFLNLLSNVMVAVFTLASIPAFIPFLRLIFGLEKQEEVPPVVFGLNPNQLVHFVKYKFAQLIQLQSKETALLYICLLLVALFFLKNLFRYLSLASMAPVRNNIVRDIRKSLYEQYIRLPLSFFQQQKKGELISRITSDLTEVEWSILNVIETLFRQPLIIIGGLVFMVYIHPTLSLVVCGLVLFTGLIIGRIGRRLKRESKLAQETQGELVSHIHETLSGIKIIKSFGAEQTISKVFDGLNNSYRQRITSLLFRRDLASPLSEFLGVSVFAVLLWYGSKIVFSGNLDPETFFAFLIAFFYIIEPAKSFANAQYHLAKGMAALDRIDGILQLENEWHQDRGIEKDSFEQGIEFEQVGFEYPGSGQAVLKAIQLTIEKGQHIALVGASGSGKSTVADLLSGFYRATSGRITIDGVPIDKIKFSALRRLIGIVTQEPILFHDTIENNIRFGRLDASKEEIVKAAKMAFAHDFIVQSPQGYETVIGDRGTKLSGGERQRIALARALLKAPPILLLDEATSSLDSRSEKLIQNALEKALQGRTALIIAHRLSTIKNCDEIIVMDKGRIVERGSHEKLVREQSAYYDLVRLQS